jgi:hypothetical protein
LHALRSQYLLQLDRFQTELFVIPTPALELASQLQQSHSRAAEPALEAARQLLQGIPKLRLQGCLKGPFHDAMQAKLRQLAHTRNNEVIPLDFDAIAARFLEEPPPVCVPDEEPLPRVDQVSESRDSQ